MSNHPILQPSGGYHRLRSFILAQLIYDITVRFVELYLDRRSRTCDQMVQAARSGVQNIAEGSVASATSKKTELKLTNVAKASLEELLLDYEDFLRQRNQTRWAPEHQLIQKLRAARISTMTEFRAFLSDTSDMSDRSDTSDKVSQSVVAAELVITLIEQATYLLARQITRQADDFKEHGGFTERLYQVRSNAKKGS